ncbi:MAG: HlyD family efflux transporter periplasmic adaptor subunit [Lachnospiraceae bacterium]|nr:HlyD family efflux transporter periplasmic adaptor subunit [Lachnospiraceae bacterium]
MNEKSTKKKDLIKNIAIIFLAVLLVLTFCSNTIMNYSLPEVAAQYCMSGSITNKVRGTGYIESEDPYKVVFKQQDRTVDSVSVRKGDEVQKGDTLYVLEEGESDQLKEARKALEEAKAEYEEYIITNHISTTITDSVKDGSAGELENNQTAIAAAEKKLENFKAAYEKLSEESSMFTNGTAASYEEYKTLDEVQTGLEQWEKQLTLSKEAWDEVSDADKAELAEVDAQYNDNYAIMSKLGGLIPGAKATYESAKAEYEKDSSYTNREAYEEAKEEYEFLQNQYSEAEDLWKAAQEAYNTSNIKPIKDKRDAYETAKKKVPEYTTLVADAKKVISDKTNELNYKVTVAKNDLDKCQKELDKISGDIKQKYDVVPKVKKIEEAQAKVDELEKSDMGGAAITAPVSGTIIDLEKVAGQTIKQGDEVATIQVAGKGFSMTLNVSTEQARLVSVGDEAEITNNWWYNDVHARVSSIRPDPSNPSKQKVINFEVSGDVSAGQSLSITVGQKTANYDIIVPTSAIHEDNNGKFVLRVNAKSTPLGNRYIAERVEVKVLAEDETRSAISGDLSGWEYIITNAPINIEDGQQVRLKD